MKHVKLVVSIRYAYLDISRDFLKELKLESGSIYSFGITYGKPLTYKNVPYKPFKLIMKNIKKGPVMIQGSAFNNYEFPFLDSDYNILFIGEEGEVVKYKDILYGCILDLVFYSDIMQGNMKNRADKPTNFGTSYPDSYIIDPVYDVMDMSLTCTKIIKDDLSNTESN
jgi:hypothetical protein